MIFSACHFIKLYVNITLCMLLYIITNARNIKQYLYADSFLDSSTIAVQREIKKSDLSGRKFFIEWQSNWHNECNFIRSNMKDRMKSIVSSGERLTARECALQKHIRGREKHEAERKKKEKGKEKVGRSIAFALLERRIDVIIYETSLTQTWNFASRVQRARALIFLPINLYPACDGVLINMDYGNAYPCSRTYLREEIIAFVSSGMFPTLIPNVVWLFDPSCNNSHFFSP